MKDELKRDRPKPIILLPSAYLLLHLVPPLLLPLLRLFFVPFIISFSYTGFFSFFPLFSSLSPSLWQLFLGHQLSIPTFHAPCPSYTPSSMPIHFFLPKLTPSRLFQNFLLAPFLLPSLHYFFPYIFSFGIIPTFFPWSLLRPSYNLFSAPSSTSLSPVTLIRGNDAEGTR